MSQFRFSRADFTELIDYFIEVDWGKKFEFSLIMAKDESRSCFIAVRVQDSNKFKQEMERSAPALEIGMAR